MPQLEKSLSRREDPAQPINPRKRLSAHRAGFASREKLPAEPGGYGAVPAASSAARRASLADPPSPARQSLRGRRRSARGAGLTEGVAAAPAGLREADDDLLQVGSGGRGRRIGVFPAIALTRFLCLKNKQREKRNYILDSKELNALYISNTHQSQDGSLPTPDLIMFSVLAGNKSRKKAKRV